MEIWSQYVSQVSHLTVAVKFHGRESTEELFPLDSILCIWTALTLSSRPNTNVLFFIQSTTVDRESHERGWADRCAILVLASTQRITLAKPFNLFEPRFSHWWNERKDIWVSASSLNCWRIKQVKAVGCRASRVWKRKGRHLTTFVLLNALLYQRWRQPCERPT